MYSPANGHHGHHNLRMDADTKTPNKDHRRTARFLYFQGWRVGEIAQYLGESRTTISSWKTRDKWDDTPAITRVEMAIEARLVQLVNKDQKSGSDIKEIDLLGRQIERLARVHKYTNGGTEVDLNPNVASRYSAPRKKPAKNEFSEAEVEKLVEGFRESLFDYQRTWYRNGHQRTRAILKSRQIGATWYFAREALVDAVQTGRNQIFLSASKAQAHVFKQYIVQFAREAIDADLRGDPIILGNGAHLYFLGTNARTAQGYHGNFYFDEFFWTNKFQELNKVASGMALHKKWRKTYFSTPSSTSHEAYPFWTGDLFNRRRSKADKRIIDVTHGALADGKTCGDNIWRQIVTILDAERGGCDLFDIDELRNYEYSPDQFENLLMCQFIDDTASVFPLAEMQRCMVDSWEVWRDVKPFAARPFGDRPVWIGYDPSHTGDSAGLVVVAPPAVDGGKFRVLERHQYRGLDFAAQAEAIRQLTLKYRVDYIGIDSSGLGQGVLQLVSKFYPAVRAYNYSPEIKTRLVLKAKDVIAGGRLEFDAGWVDLAQAFMSVRKVLTNSRRQVTYDATRSEDTGHADLAWACMHALDNEPLEGRNAANSGFLEIYS